MRYCRCRRRDSAPATIEHGADGRREQQSDEEALGRHYREEVAQGDVQDARHAPSPVRRRRSAAPSRSWSCSSTEAFPGDEPDEYVFEARAR